jgi:nucleoside-diphosphate-sugar epimerase
VKQLKIAKRIPNEFRFVAICPTEVLGPPLNTKVPFTGSMASLKSWCSTLGKSPVPNDSMSLVHVEDCADFHVKALEDPKAWKIRLFGGIMALELYFKDDSKSLPRKPTNNTLRITSATHAV